MPQNDVFQSPPDRPELRCLQAMPVFGGLDASCLDWLIERAPRVRVPAGGWFFREGDRGTTLYVLLQGRVTLSRSLDGVDEPLGSLAPGDCFGEMSLFDLSPRSATVCAVEDSLALAIDTGLLYALYSQAPESYTIILMNLGRELSRRLRVADERLSRLLENGAATGAGV
jgi:CRP-like cAMP-binding protein